MRTIKTYFKGAPFYIASAYRNVAFRLATGFGPRDLYRELGDEHQFGSFGRASGV